MKAEQTWFVASDAERMRVYTFVVATDGSKRFVQIEERVHPASALKNSELVTSDYGHFKIMTRSSAVGKMPGSKYDPRFSPHLLEAMHFAKEVADYLYTSHMRGKFKHLVLCAADHFCGLLRPELKPALMKATYIERKGYTKTPIKKLEAIALSLINAKEPTKPTTKKVNTAPVKEKAYPARAKAKLTTKAKKTPVKAKTKSVAAAKPKAKTKPAAKVATKKAKTSK